MSEPASNGLSKGEAKIRRAFFGSLLVVALAVLAGASLWWLNRSNSTKVPVQDASVEGPAPAVTADAATTPPAVRFTDITEQAGIRFVHVNGAYGERLMPETMGSGAAFIDYDNDGDQDLFLVNSRYWPGHAGAGKPRQTLHRNDGRGNFEDVSESAGIAVEAYGMGVAVGDYDNDGWDDLYLTTVYGNLLFHNEKGRFRDVTKVAGVGGREADWSTGATFLDYDNDGDLDLFVANYVKWTREIDLEINFRLTGLGRAYGAPNHFTGTHNYLFRNDGGGRFSNVSQEAGIEVSDPQSGLPAGKGLGVVAADYDGDGWVDLVVANDTVRKFLYHNLKNGRFEEVGVFEGVAYDRDGKSTSGMGIDAAWYRNDADLGVAVGNFANEMTSLYVTSEGKTPFADEAMLEGIGPASRLALTFGVLFLDYDLDGRLDLLQANGHLEHEISKVQPSQHYAQPGQLFWNCADCKARFLPVEDPGDLKQEMVGRGAAYADIDGDGDLDVLITQNGRRPALLRNDLALGHHFLRVKLDGVRANRNGIGARVELIASATLQRREATPSRGYLTQVEMPLTFGLEKAEQVGSLKVTWPGGQVQEVAVDKVDTTMVVRQPPQ